MSRSADLRGRWLLGGAATMLALLVVVELYEIHRGHEPATLKVLLFELLELMFLVGCTILLALLVTRKGNERDAAAAIRGLRVTRAWSGQRVRERVESVGSGARVRLGLALQFFRDQAVIDAAPPSLPIGPANIIAPNWLGDDALEFLEAVYFIGQMKLDRRTHTYRLRTAFSSWSEERFNKTLNRLRELQLVDDDSGWISLTATGLGVLEKQLFQWAVSMIIDGKL